MTKKPKSDDIDFETAYRELDALVETMEKGEQSLEDSFKDFERGVELVKLCHQRLKSVEQRVEILVKDNQGLLSTEPFDTEE